MGEEAMNSYTHPATVYPATNGHRLGQYPTPLELGLLWSDVLYVAVALALIAGAAAALWWLRRA